MRNILFIILLLPIFCHAQTNIEGIGIFRMGKSYDEIVAGMEKEGIEYKNYTDINDNERYLYYFHNVECNKCSAIYIKECNIAGVKIRKITLSFYSDILYEISSAAPGLELKDAITVAYGKPIESQAIKPIQCVYKLTGNETTENEITESVTWRNDSIIRCQYVFNVSYDEKCQKIYYTNFLVENRKLAQTAAICANEAHEIRIKDDEKSKINKYKNFK